MIHNRKPILRLALSLLIAVIFVLGAASPLAASESAPELTARTAVLMDADTGRVLFGKDERRRIYPASMTKTLTAMVALDYLKPEELVVVGEEINSVPSDSSKAGHVVGETISVMNLLRGLMIVSGNETACTLALATARRASGDASMDYATAEKYFCELMNQKALSLGAEDSNFSNPHGYHSESLYSTAYDMALISRAAMEISLIHSLSSETSFTGNGAGYNADVSLTTKNYNWKTSNELLLPGTYYYPYATGIKTGRHSNAGDCLSAMAEKDGVRLIVVICDSLTPGRWLDAIGMFEYGFNSFANRVIYESWTKVGEIPLDNPRKQEPSTLDYYITQPVEGFVSLDEIKDIAVDVIFAGDLLTTNENAKDGLPPGTPRLITPVKDGDILGTATYSLYGMTLYEGFIIAGRDARIRTFYSDMQYFFANFTDLVFTTEAVLFWVAVGLIIAVTITVICLVSASRRRSRSMFTSRRRFY